MKVYMIGIGGIGMSGLAQLYLREGIEVTGSDREHGPTTDMLEKLGVKIYYQQNGIGIPDDTNLIIYSDAIWPDNPERARARALFIPEMSYFAALGKVSEAMTTIAVSGTNGKTTTTGMLAKILIDAGKQPTTIVGSLMKDFGSNFVPGAPSLFVVEACEYKDHLLELNPKILVVTNVEWDHTDWFKTEAAMFDTFKRAMHKVPKDGAVVVDLSLPYMRMLLTEVRATIVDYSKEIVPELQLIGEFNKNNARAAKAAAKAFAPELTDEVIDASLKAFQGTWRRFEYKGITKAGATLYDDYAHHPTAIRETIKGARQKFSDKKIVVAFHPHLFSRTRDLMNDFARAFDGADSVILAPIYAARENPIDGVTSEVLASKINNSKPNLACAVSDLDAVYNELVSVSSDSLIITMGAGDIYKVADKLVA
ncbi:MAG: Mur ligase domain-containing protein [Patescibacteria group bacterium]